MGSGSSKRAVSPKSAQSTTNSPQTVQAEEFTEDNSQRVVVVTGCSSGIGLALAVLLSHDADKRFKVYATMRNLGKKDALLEKCSGVVEDLLNIKELDVCSDESVKAVVAEIVEKEGRIDVLVNNAGIGLFCVPECATTDAINKVFEPNVYGLMRMTNAVIPHMKKQRAGHVVNIGSVLGVVGTPFSEIYCASKFAVEGYAEAMAPVLGKFNIKTTIIEPGPVATNFASNAKAIRDEVDISGTDEQTQALLKSALTKMYHSLTNYGQTPEEIAELTKKALLLKRPPLRLQTNSKYRPDQVAAKLSDPSGNKIVELSTSYFFPEQ
ncbi:retinol dehydrogenase 8 [Nematostella vectensis]|uniref:retinol dehydrogenase 8 n=1 Tax=Nematostella vectensis TaxID=45351 RepID=UPI0020772C09|nr:retinol dehydrogenase 8 [Nematostella vectensis]